MARPVCSLASRALALLGAVLLPMAVAVGPGLARAGDPLAGVGSELVIAGLDRPVFVTAPEGDDRLFVVEQRGRIVIVENGVERETPFLDIDALVTNLVSAFDERGLLGLAFHPDYPESGCFFVNYTQSFGNGTAIARYQVGPDPNVADPASGELLLTIVQPFANHNGGHVAFGPEATPTLYVGMGDGGSADDPGNRAQAPQELLGKMLRLGVGCSGGYTIPADNPHVGEADPEDAILDEIWATGLRNPYRFSFDRSLGDLYIGDVGQDAFEEIDFEEAGSPGGLNFGWRIEEASSCFDENQAAVPCGDPSLTRPIYEYPHPSPCGSVTGGYVYRGAIEALRGRYIFGDYCSSQILSFFYDTESGVQGFTDLTAQLEPEGDASIDNPVGFGEDGHGELYIVSRGAQNAVFRVVPEPGSTTLALAAVAFLASLASSRRRYSR